MYSVKEDPSGISDEPEGVEVRQTRAEPLRYGREGRTSIGRVVAGAHGRNDVADSTCMISLTCPERIIIIDVHGQSALVLYCCSGCRYGHLGRCRRRVQKIMSRKEFRSNRSLAKVVSGYRRRVGIAMEHRSPRTADGIVQVVAKGYRNGRIADAVILGCRSRDAMIVAIVYRIWCRSRPAWTWTSPGC
jgi:hypothetical protein